MFWPCWLLSGLFPTLSGWGFSMGTVVSFPSRLARLEPTIGGYCGFNYYATPAPSAVLAEPMVYSPLADQWVPWAMIERATTARVLEAVFYREVSP